MPIFRSKEQDPVLDDLIAEPVRVVRPQRQLVPFVFASPHSGRLYPPCFAEKSRLSATALRRSEDAFVDELFDACRELGAPMLIARFPRAYLDANRAPTELDPGMFDGMLPFAVDRASPRVHAGLGIIPRVVREGMEIYRAKLSVWEAEFRIQNFYRPYHLQLGRLVESTRTQFGIAIVVDCHSMPSAAASPDVVIGDRLGLSAFPEVTATAERAIVDAGFTLARNAPYAGGHTIHLYGRPCDNVHALQIEINRGLYLDEDRVERASGFAQIRRRLGEALLQFLTRDVFAKTATTARIAAE